MASWGKVQSTVKVKFPAWDVTTELIKQRKLTLRPVQDPLPMTVVTGGGAGVGVGVELVVVLLLPHPYNPITRRAAIIFFIFMRHSSPRGYRTFLGGKCCLPFNTRIWDCQELFANQPDCDSQAQGFGIMSSSPMDSCRGR